ncbi:MAG: ribosome biogenesis GTPase Der [Phycisphaerales bacterium]|nr:ribosome biogenesis GTPase Der [Phycisphaerales bacterium]
MGMHRVAIVGRPNVGKSSLLNMLARSKVSIVDPTPGVTRDRVSTIVELEGPKRIEEPLLVEVTDTGGYGVYMAEGGRFDDAGMDLQKLTGSIEGQIASAVERADLILFVIDAQAGVTALDETVAKLLRERAMKKGDRSGDGKRVPVMLVANKVDAENWEPHALEASALGFGEPIIVSALNNFRRREMREKLWKALHEITPGDDDGRMPEMQIALVGRRNAGKSSFVNALAGSERCIVSEIPGTTRDAIDVRFEVDGKSLLAIDTAGVRKRSKFADAVEHFANMRMAASIRRADVVLLLIDSTEAISGVDKRLGAQVRESFKPCIIVVSKWDLAKGRKNVKGKPITTDDYRDYLDKELPGLVGAPIVFTSSKDGTNVHEVIDVAFDLYEQSRTRLSTGELNRIMKDILASRGPGGRGRVYYASQVATSPPTIVLMVNKPDLFEGNYERFLLNRFREMTPFAECPVRLIIRERKRASLQDLLSGAHRKSKEVGKIGGGEMVEDDGGGWMEVGEEK